MAEVKHDVTPLTEGKLDFDDDTLKSVVIKIQFFRGFLEAGN